MPTTFAGWGPEPLSEPWVLAPARAYTSPRASTIQTPGPRGFAVTPTMGDDRWRIAVEDFAAPTPRTAPLRHVVTLAVPRGATPTTPEADLWGEAVAQSRARIVPPLVTSTQDRYSAGDGK